MSAPPAEAAYPRAQSDRYAGMRRGLFLTWILPLFLPGLSQAMEKRLSGEEFGEHCPSLLYAPRLTADEYQRIRFWEDKHLAGMPKPFLRAWRLALHRKRLQWIEFCERAGPGCESISMPR